MKWCSLGRNDQLYDINLQLPLTLTQYAGIIILSLNFTLAQTATLEAYNKQKLTHISPATYSLVLNYKVRVHRKMVYTSESKDKWMVSEQLTWPVGLNDKHTSFAWWIKPWRQWNPGKEKLKFALLYIPL